MGEVCKLHKCVMNTCPAHQQMDLRTRCKCPFKRVNKQVLRPSQPVNEVQHSRAGGSQPTAGPCSRSLAGGHILTQQRPVL